MQEFCNHVGLFSPSPFCLLHCFWEVWTVIPLNVIFLWVLPIFSLFVWFSVVDCDVSDCDFLSHILLRTHWAAWICKLSSFTKFHVFFCLILFCPLGIPPLGTLDFSLFLGSLPGEPQWMAYSRSEGPRRLTPILPPQGSWWGVPRGSPQPELTLEPPVLAPIFYPCHPLSLSTGRGAGFTAVTRPHCHWTASPVQCVPRALRAAPGPSPPGS